MRNFKFWWNDFFVGMEFNFRFGKWDKLRRVFPVNFTRNFFVKIFTWEFYLKWTEIIKFTRDCFCKMVKPTFAIFTMNLFCKVVAAFPRPNLVRTLSGGAFVSYGCPSYLHFHLPNNFLGNYTISLFTNGISFSIYPCEFYANWTHIDFKGDCYI